MQPRLVLASSSPRRIDLLKAVGLDCIVHPSTVEESGLPSASPPRVTALQLALAKAQSVALDYPSDIVVAADTVVALGNEIFGKPADAEDGRRMLERLSGQTHSVITAVAIAYNGSVDLDAVETRVTMRAIDASELEDYLRSGDPLDKAGAYGIQSGAGKFITRLEGDYYNVVGLPLAKLLEMLSGYMDVRGLKIPPAPIWR
ncbi:MAG: Maf family protein [bacterium]